MTTSGGLVLASSLATADPWSVIVGTLSLEHFVLRGTFYYNFVARDDASWYHLNIMKESAFHLEFERESDGRWIAEVPELPGVMAYGSSKKEASCRVYSIAIYKGDKQYVAEGIYVPVVTQGKTLDELAENIREAVSLQLESIG